MSLENTINHHSGIHLKLRDLIQLKSRRDGKEFSINQLAKALDMPHSMLVKLVHQDPAKRVMNPRIETLSKIVEFFKSEGFAITIDDFIFGKNEIHIDSVRVEGNTENRHIEVFSLNNVFDNIGKIDVTVSKSSNELVAFISEIALEPFFKAGSIFIVDTTIPMENENLIAVRIGNEPVIQIKKMVEHNNSRFLCSLNQKEEVRFSPILHHIIGVVVQVNAKT